MNLSENRTRAIIAQEAADWFVANREGQDAVRQGNFAEWLKASPVHVEEYLGFAQLSGDLRQAAVDPELSIDVLMERALAEDDVPDRAFGAGIARPPRSIVRSRWMVAAAAAAAVLLAVGLTLYFSSALRLGPSAPSVAELRFTTQHGEQLSRSLADASVLHLNTDTSVRVRFDRTSRWITIERGQVFFEVAHDVKRPFRVIAGSAEVVAVGTKFDVYLQTGSALVTVVEGRVDVGSISQLSSAEIERAATRGSIRLGAGQQIRVLQGELPSQPSRVDTQSATAWLRRQIAFDHEPLAAVAAEFNRYGAAPIEIETPALRDRPISGVFAADDSESFVAFLRSLDGVRVEVTSTRIRVFKPAM